MTQTRLGIVLTDGYSPSWQSKQANQSLQVLIKNGKTSIDVDIEYNPRILSGIEHMKHFCIIKAFSDIRNHQRVLLLETLQHDFYEHMTAHHRLRWVQLHISKSLLACIMK